MRIRSCVAVACLVLPAASASFGAVILNGSFEQPGTGFRTVGPGSTFGDWTCSGPSDIEFVETVVAPALPGLEASGYDGRYWIDLTGVGAPSGIYQDITTDIGQPYRVDFAMAGNVWSDAQVMIMDVLWNGTVVGTFQHDTTGHTGFDMGWTQYSVVVTGSGLDRLQFKGLTGAVSAGVALDAVSITEVPAPASLVIGACGVLVGARRRRG